MVQQKCQKSLNCDGNTADLKDNSSVVFSNEGQVAQIPIQEHKSVSAKCFVQNMLSKAG